MGCQRSGNENFNAYHCVLSWTKENFTRVHIGITKWEHFILLERKIYDEIHSGTIWPSLLKLSHHTHTTSNLLLVHSSLTISVPSLNYSRPSESVLSTVMWLKQTGHQLHFLHLNYSISVIFARIAALTRCQHVLLSPFHHAVSAPARNLSRRRPPYVSHKWHRWMTQQYQTRQPHSCSEDHMYLYNGWTLNSTVSSDFLSFNHPLCCKRMENPEAKLFGTGRSRWGRWVQSEPGTRDRGHLST